MIGKKRNGGRDDGPLVLDAAVVGVGHKVSGGAEAGAPPRRLVIRRVCGIQAGPAGIELENLRRAPADRSVDAEFLSAGSDGPIMERDVDGFGDDRLCNGGQGKKGEGGEDRTRQFHAPLR